MAQIVQIVGELALLVFQAPQRLLPIGVEGGVAAASATPMPMRAAAMPTLPRLLPAFMTPAAPTPMSASHPSTPENKAQDRQTYGPPDDKAQDHQGDPGQFSVIVNARYEIHGNPS